MAGSPPYRFEERVRLSEDDSSTRHVSAEIIMSWPPEQDNHLPIDPFSRLQQAWKMPNYIVQVIMSIASQALAGHPSGFWLQIQSMRPLSPEDLRSLTNSWQDSRLLTTPLEGGVWDTIARQPGMNTTTYQVFLPTKGAAWSADALQQSFSNLPCPHNFLGLSSMDLSKLFVDGLTTNKHMWIVWNHPSPSDPIESQVGISFTSLVDIPTPLLGEIASCPLANRSFESWQGPASPSLPSLAQVVRRPTPNEGRLETWFESDNGQESCKFMLRQRLPYYFEPKWRTLEVVSSSDDGLSVSVVWNPDDLSSVLTVSHSKTPSSVVVSLDYEPVFLSLDDFPGDPNRGRELPPAVVTLICPDAPHPRHIFSNSVLMLPPVPDMSMPFNVLSLTCSLYAYLIGTLMTLLVKRVSERVRYKLHPDQKPPTLKQKLRTKLSGILAKVRSKFHKGSGNSVATKSQEGESSTAGGEVKISGKTTEPTATAESRLNVYD